MNIVNAVLWPQDLHSNRACYSHVFGNGGPGFRSTPLVFFPARTPATSDYYLNPLLMHAAFYMTAIIFDF